MQIMTLYKIVIAIVTADCPPWVLISEMGFGTELDPGFQESGMPRHAHGIPPGTEEG